MDRSGLALLARALKLPPNTELPDDPLDLCTPDERFSIAFARALASASRSCLRVVGPDLGSADRVDDDSNVL